MKKLIIFLFILILLIGVVQAAQPPTIEYTGEEGFKIQYPLISTAKKDQDVTLRFQVFNMTTGSIKDNISVSCRFHLYNNTGHLLLEWNNLSNMMRVNEYVVDVNGYYLDSVGEYHYAIRCNDSTYGGFIEAGFTVTETGDENAEYDLVSTGIILAIAILVLLFMGWVFDREVDRSFVYYLSFPCWYIALLIPLYGMNILLNSEKISSNIKGLLNTLSITYTYFYYFLVLMLIVYFLVLFLTWLAWWNTTPPYKRKRLDERQY